VRRSSAPRISHSACTTLRPLPDPSLIPPRVTRRTLLKAGVAGGAALLLARWLYTGTSAPTPPDSRFAALNVSARAIVAAIVPVLLDGALPTGPDALAARAAVLAGVDQAIAGLPPAARREIDDLFSLLAFAPTRCVIAGVWSPWPEASRDSVAAFVAAWRSSRFDLLRSAYGALHQIVFGAWYGMERAWPAIGYPGPPSLETG
jgi:hypothetical protein